MAAFWPELIDQNPAESLRPNLNSATYFEIACVAVTHNFRMSTF